MTLSKQLTLWQFITGLLLSLLATYCSYKQTGNQIAAQGAENQRVHDSARLREVSTAVSEVRQQLFSYASMAVEIQVCLSKPKVNAQTCLRVPYDYDGIAAQKAWSNLDASIRAARPFFASEAEVKLLGALDTAKESHRAAIQPLLPPDSVGKAKAVQSATELTINTLGQVEGQLEKVVMQRALTK